MPAFPEEPEIHESIPGPGVPVPRESDAQALSTPATGGVSPVIPPTPGAARTAPAAAVPGPRPAPPRPAVPRPGPPRPGPRVAKAPGPGAQPGPRDTPAGPAVQLLPGSPETVLARADEAVDLLLESGRDPGGILVLTAAAPHPWQQHELSFGADRYWAQLAEGNDVFYADLAISRPARRDVVVLVLDGASADQAEQAVGKALTHAVSLLVICGGTAQLSGLSAAGQAVPA